MERLKQENIKKRAEREAELLRQADQLQEAMVAAKQAARDGKYYAPVLTHQLLRMMDSPVNQKLLYYFCITIRP